MRTDSAELAPLTRDYGDFLTAFASACQRAQMYPEGHPTLDRALDQALERHAAVVADRPAVVFSVAANRLLVGTTASDPGHPLQRELAGRLFRRDIGSIRLGRGLHRAELSQLLGHLTRDAPETVRYRSGHVDVEPLTFEGLALDATGGFASTADALGALQTRAAAEGRHLSDPLARLLGKLVQQADQGSAASRHRAADQFFGLLHDIRTAWDGPGAAGVAPLDRLPPVLSSHEPDRYRADPMRLLTMQLDVGELFPSAARCVDTLVAGGSARPLVDLMQRIPPEAEVAGRFHPLVARSGALAALLAAEPVAMEAVERLAPEAGEPAIPLLLDALAVAGERSRRRRLLELLAHFGGAIVPHVLRRLPDAPWYLQRNLLRLLQMVPDPPAESVAAEYARHPDPRVRVEGFRLLMRHPSGRDKGIIAGLSDPDSSGPRIAVLAAGEDCPPGAAPLLLSGLREGRIDPGLVPAAIRAIGSMTDLSGVVEVLLGFAGRRFPVLGWRLGVKSKASLAALSALARHWGTDPRAATLVARARRHRDPDVRQAVGA
jgi:hypothetical protein